MHPRSMAKDLSETVKEILGICVFVGCTVEGKDPKDLQQEIIEGDEEIPQDWLLIDGIRVNYDLIIPLMEVSNLRWVPTAMDNNQKSNRKLHLKQW